MTTLVGMVTFGLLDFTKLTIKSIRETTISDIDFYVIVGKPRDIETVGFLESEGIPYKAHKYNYGFPYSINDIYDYAWKDNNYDNLILVGNDIVAYPNCIDSMINLANNSDYELISASQLEVRNLVELYPQTRDQFAKLNYIFTDFTKEPWKEFKDFDLEQSIEELEQADIQNACLYKRSVFDTIGYTDVNFYPAYFVDNDYAKRCFTFGIKSCALTNARFFHFWSRTIKQGSGGSTNKYFEANRYYYRKKWGGEVGKETIQAPIKISSRDNEITDINKWRR